MSSIIEIFPVLNSTQWTQFSECTGKEVICSTLGAVPGNSYVNGDDFIQTSFGYQHKHKWRGLGIGLAYIIFFLFLYLLICEYNEGAKQKGEMLVFPHSVVKKMREKGQTMEGSSSTTTPGAEKDLEMNNDSSVTDKRLLRDSDSAVISNSNAIANQHPLFDVFLIIPIL